MKKSIYLLLFFSLSQYLPHTIITPCISENNFVFEETSLNRSVEKINYSDIDTYVSNKYASLSPSLYSSGRLSGLSASGATPFMNQMDESVFVRNVGIYTYSEGNCGLVSTSNILMYHRIYNGKYYFPSINSFSVVIPYANTTLLTQATLNGYSPKSSSVSLHTLYFKEREYAITQGYVTGGMNDSMTKYVVENTSSFYNYNVSFIPYSSFNQSDIINEINNDRPIQLRSSSLDPTYGGHGFMATGYKIYYCTLYDSFYDTYYYRLLMCLSVFDGSNGEYWIDLPDVSGFPSDYSRDTGVTIAKIIFN